MHEAEKFALLPSTQLDPPREPSPSKKWIVVGGMVLLGTVAVSALVHTPRLVVVTAKSANLKATFPKSSEEI